MHLRTTLAKTEMVETFKSLGLRIGIAHAGGPAPGGNLVFYAAGLRGRDYGIPVIAFKHGFEGLEKLDKTPEEVMREWGMPIGAAEIRYMRDQCGLVAGTSRANPSVISKEVKILTLDDLEDEKKTVKLVHVLAVLEAYKIGAFISVGGDDTMRTANLLHLLYQKLLAKGVEFKNLKGIIHVPKTIDKDYFGIDFTFGFMSAAEFIGKTVKGFHDDAKSAATKNQPVYHIVEIMGRAAGWLCAASSIYGQSTYTIVPEQFEGRKDISLDELAQECVDVILTRRKQGKHYGVITIAEGVGDLLKVDATLDEFGHTRLDQIDLGKRLKNAIASELNARVGLKAKLHDQKTGYAARQVEPNIFDVLLCQALGVAAVDGIMNEYFGHMVSVSGVFTPGYIPFSNLVDPATLKVRNWTMKPEEGLYRLMVAMEQLFDRNVGIDAPQKK